MHLPKPQSDLPQRGEKWFYKKQIRNKKKKDYILIGDRHNLQDYWWIYLYDLYGNQYSTRGLISLYDLQEKHYREQI